jgi:hypothetical protein
MHSMSMTLAEFCDDGEEVIDGRRLSRYSILSSIKGVLTVQQASR